MKLSVLLMAVTVAAAPAGHGPSNVDVDVGVRPGFLVSLMPAGPLKEKLASCASNKNMRLHSSDFTISHRGAPLQFPEHTKAGLAAAARMGAGILECDVAFTRDRQLVCRHSQCDLHTTTNILAVPELAAKCTRPFTPAAGGRPASALCCTSDITLAEFKSLCGKMDGFDPKATTAAEYMDGTPKFRTDLYASTCGELYSHKEYIRIVDGYGLKFTPELKAPEVPMPFEGDYTQEEYAQQLIDEYRAARIHPDRVFLQSFSIQDIYYWNTHAADYARQAMYLDSRPDTPEGAKQATASMAQLKQSGIRTLSPAFHALLKLDANNQIVPSDYAVAAKKAGIKLTTWSLERSGPLNKVKANKDFYYSSIAAAIKDDGDIYRVVDVLARKVGVAGIFSDWPATVSFYANCFGL
ncbi:putative glycerophosphodiester phosphodiesterase [Microsporum canis]|uniref:glycerophosphodiester phosphodiesterase n=1 Tax=Arthroderma otae (strain ATCC MYA-4605 / CBS 113480) TaxID=554155 RepID=C5FRP2_ARTOC|nr:glycerophosphoryl diester phosphodiesterase family protein [Microsporum canis CBS 113480]EEQ32545.1 glycerophosphoryl diester phosphodiesterase family protein [Microsporum canis CBS 113480]